MDTLQVAGMISKELKRSGVVEKAPLLASNIAMSFSSAGLKLCDLKPLAEVLHCEPEMGALMSAARDGTWSLKTGKIYAAIAQAFNWERTEFDTLDELLAAIREQEQAHSNFVDMAIRDDERIDKVRELLCLLAETLGRTPLLDEAIELLEPRSSRDDLVELDAAKVKELLKGGHIPTRAPMRVVDVMNGLPPTYNFPCSLKHYMPVPTTHTLLHAGELYRDVTILLHTEQLVAWRTADGQEYSAKAHRVTLDPDEDGLAAAILSRIAGVEIAPEHMAELRAQMAGGVSHG